MLARTVAPTTAKAPNEPGITSQTKPATRENLPVLGFDLGLIPLYPSTPKAKPAPPKPAAALTTTRGLLCAKLSIGSVDDPLEREADLTAEKVVRMPAPTATADGTEPPPDPPSVTAADTRLSRKCDACRKEDEEEKGAKVQRRATSGAPKGAAAAPPIVDQVLSSPGRPLDAGARAFFEPRFGADLSDVRIHTGSKAEASAKAVNALAYTVGSNIVFGPGRYAPTELEGRLLLAHELTHVIQQPAETMLHRDVDDDPAFDEPGEDKSKPTTDAGDKKADCPKPPTGLSAKEPDKPCPRATHAGTNELTRFYFCPGHDMLDPTDQGKELKKLVDAAPPARRWLIHGYASSEGNVEDSFKLSCRRANAVAEILRPLLRRKLLNSRAVTPDRIDVELDARIEAATRGPANDAPGGHDYNRMVVLYGQDADARTPEEPRCAGAPKGLGDITPAAPGCDAPTVDLTSESGGPSLRHFHFCLDSDVLAAEDASAIKGFAESQAASAHFVVHGFASTEGAKDYNQRLSCHRALRVARELLNAGVRPDRIREVSGLGETDKFPGALDFNRLVIVKAEGGTIGPIADKPRPATTVAQKRAIVDEARARIVSGQYRQAADAYISRWTCGRTPSVSQIVERLEILVEDGTKDAEIGGTAEAAGGHTIRVSTKAMLADNALECVMATIVDMAFHQAVRKEPGLSEDLISENTPDDKGNNGFKARHAAGLHLAHLAGFGACRGQSAGLIDAPTAEDPRAGRPAPSCADVPQQTRLLPPTALDQPPGGGPRQAPKLTAEPPTYTVFKGETRKESEARPLTHATTRGPILEATATVQMDGPADEHANYEVGFVQAVLSDTMQVDYVTGDRVIQKLPVPIRHAEVTATGAAAPAPWVQDGSKARFGADGSAKVHANPRLDTQFAFFFKHFRESDGLHNVVDTLHRETVFGTWLVARRLGGPLDRFSAQFLHSAVHYVTQDLNNDVRRVAGSMDNRVAAAPGTSFGEFDKYIGTGTFTTVDLRTTADPSRAQLGGADASEIIVDRQVTQVSPPQEAASKKDAMSLAEYTAAVTRILDELRRYKTDGDAANGGASEVVPRLGFSSAPLTITVLIDRKTGRVPAARQVDDFVTVESPALQWDATQGLHRALQPRLAKRNFSGGGKDLVLDPSVIPGTDPVGKVVVTIPPMVAEPDLSKDALVLQDMADMWECTKLSKSAAYGGDAREFVAVYYMKRGTPTVERVSANRFDRGDPQDSKGWETRFPCKVAIETYMLGTVHTHPESPSVPSDADLDLAKQGTCGRQHFIVSEDGVYSFHKGEATKLVKKLEALPKGVACDTATHFEDKKVKKDKKDKKDGD